MRRTLPPRRPFPSLLLGLAVALLLGISLPAPSRACRTVYEPPLSLPEDGAAVVGTVLDVVSVEARGDWWSNERTDARVFGLRIEVDEAAWNPFDRTTFEVYPFSYDARCRYWSSTPEDLEAYRPGTRIWVVGSLFEEATGDDRGQRVRARGVHTWGRYDERLEQWNRSPFDFASYLDEIPSRHSGGYLGYAHVHALVQIAGASTVEEQLPHLRGLQHLLRDERQYEQLIDLYLLDERWREQLLEEWHRLAEREP